MDIGRRTALAAGLGIGLAPLAAAIADAGRRAAALPAAVAGQAATDFGLEPNAAHDQTERLQKAIDETSQRQSPLWLAPGTYLFHALTLPDGARITGVPGASILRFAGNGDGLVALSATHVTLQGLVIDGDLRAFPDANRRGLVTLTDCERLALRDLEVRNTFGNGVSLMRCAGRISDCTLHHAGHAGLFSVDARGLEITHTTVADCANNGILVWREKAGDDGTIIANNRIERIAALAGGSGQNGNGINVYRAGGVLVASNRIADCAYTAIRGNAASNIQMVANSCTRLGEVALYAEFGFEGALIANNLVDTAAAGISVTNFNEGGRLAVVQGNIVRNLARREHEPEDKRGEGIAVEADAVVTGNVVENATTAGIFVGWTKWMREVVVTSNLVRRSRIGIGVTGDRDAGAVLVTANLISGATDGAIRAMQRHAPYGPDLAATRTETARVLIHGNAVG